MKVFLSIAAAILLMASGAFFFWLYQQRTAISFSSTEQVTPEVSPIIIETTSSPTVTLSPTPQVSDEDSIKDAMAAKHNRPVSEVNLTVSKNVGTHATGSVSFAGEMGGGWWLAAKTAGGWVIVDDGNGTMGCAVIAPYNFPTSIVPECWDEATDKIVVR